MKIIPYPLLVKLIENFCNNWEDSRLHLDKRGLKHLIATLEQYTEEIDYQPVFWIKVINFNETLLQCSNCGYTVNFNSLCKLTHCPQCKRRIYGKSFLDS